MYSDLSFLMNWITDRVEAAGGMPEEITLTSVDTMYKIVAAEIDGDGGVGRNAQKKWITVVREIRKKQKEAMIRANSGIRRN